MCSNVADDVRKKLEEETAKGRRVIGIAYRKLNEGEEKLDFEKIENGLSFVGLISFEDPPRAGVRETILRASRAGIRTIMVTGDHPLTARYIAQEVGILNENGKVLTGEDLDKMSDEELKNTVKEVSVFARATPQHKYRIVQALQKMGKLSR